MVKLDEPEHIYTDDEIVSHFNNGIDFILANKPIDKIVKESQNNTQMTVSIYFSNKIISEHTFHIKTLNYIIHYYDLKYSHDSYENDTPRIANIDNLNKHYRKKYFQEMKIFGDAEKWAEEFIAETDEFIKNHKIIRKILPSELELQSIPPQYDTLIVFADDTSMPHRFNSWEMKYVSDYYNLHFNCAGYKAAKCINDREYNYAPGDKYICAYYDEYTDDTPQHNSITRKSKCVIM